jgi:hypothetical protein
MGMSYWGLATISILTLEKLTEQGFRIKGERTNDINHYLIIN